MMKIDSHSVGKLELMAPGASLTDARTVEGWLASGEVLRGFSALERRRMWEWLRGYDGIIPSLRSFFRDLDYLKSCADTVKRLVKPTKNETTLRKAMRYHCVPTDSIEEGIPIQTSECTFERHPGSRQMHQELAYRQVWLYAMRHYTQMPKDPTKPNRLAKPRNERVDETAIHEMAKLAQQLGFRSTAIKTLIDQSPDVLIAQHALLEARQQDRYEYHADVFDTLVRRIVECFSMATPRERLPPPDHPGDSSADLKARSGLPSTYAQKRDRRFLFLHHLHTSSAIAETVSTWYVRRCVYLAFFGRLPDSYTAPFPASSVPHQPLHTDVPASPLFLPNPGTSSLLTEPPLRPTANEDRDHVAQQEHTGPTENIPRPVDVMPGIEMTEPGELSERALIVWEADPPQREIEEENLTVMEPRATPDDGIEQAHIQRDEGGPVVEPATREEDENDGPIPESEHPPRPEDALIPLAQPESDGSRGSQRENDEHADRSSTSTQIHLPNRLPSLIARLREFTSPEDRHAVEGGELSERDPNELAGMENISPDGDDGAISDLGSVVETEDVRAVERDDFTQTRNTDDLFDDDEEMIPPHSDDPPVVDAPSSHGVRRAITFKRWTGVRWTPLERVEIDSANPFHVERVASRLETTDAENHGRAMFADGHG